MDASTLPELAAFSQHTTVHIDQAQLDKFWKAYTPVFEKTSACPECLYFEVLEDPDVAGKITWIVNWDASPQWVFGVRRIPLRQAKATIAVPART